MRFAVIMPLHNKGTEVAQALESVLSQSLPADEIIVVDDASGDDGPSIVAGLNSAKVKMLHRQMPGPGGYAARNLAIAHSNAEWCAFLDADDVWHGDHLEALADLARAHPSAGCVATRYTHVFNDRTEPDQVAPELANGCAVRLDFAGFLRAWLAAEHCPLWTGALAIRRDVLARSGVFPAGLADRGGDKDLWLRVMRHTNLAFLPRSTADFRRDGADKLTHRTGTRHLPCLVPTARRLSREASATAEERRFLRRLANQEIMLYARWAARTGERPHTGLRDLQLPASLRALGTVTAARHLPKSWLRAGYAVAQSRRARLRTQ